MGKLISQATGYNPSLDFYNYAQHGASQLKNAFKGSVDILKDADEDIGDNKDILMSRSREMYMGNTIALAAFRKFRTNVVGKGLKVKPKIDAEFLNIGEEEVEKIQKMIEYSWELWSNSKECDICRMSNFAQLQSLAFLTQLVDGECFVLLPFKRRAGEVFDLKIQLIDSARCRNPASYDPIKQDIKNGVEIDKDGAPIAYYFTTDRYGLETIRVDAYGKKTGRRNVLLLMEKERIGQRRGIPLLAPILESLYHLTKFTQAELTNAVVSALFTAFIERETKANPGEPPIEEVDIEEDEDGDINLKMGNGTIVELPPGRKMSFADPSRPNQTFDNFFSAMVKHIGAALELPYEVLLNAFNSNYSASRAALNEAWKVYLMRREWLVSDFCQPIYEEFVDNLVARGYIKINDYFENPFVRKAFLKTEWYGSAQGQLDPIKEVRASVMKIENNMSTLAKETMEMTGGDYESNLKQRAKEKELEKKYGLLESSE